MGQILLRAIITGFGLKVGSDIYSRLKSSFDGKVDGEESDAEADPDVADAHGKGEDPAPEDPAAEG